MKKIELVFNLQGSKSIINRLLIMATYLDEPLTICNFSNCSDVNTLLDSLNILGFEYKRTGNNCTILPGKNKILNASLKIKDAGTAFRFLLARLAVWEELTTNLSISQQLSTRPIKPLINKLNSCGAEIEINGTIKITGKSIDTVSGNFPANISSQFISSIMLIAPVLKNGVDLKFENKPVSSDYLILTKNVLSLFGINSKLSKHNVHITGGQTVHSPGNILVDPDYSSASYFWALGALSSLPIGVYTAGNKFKQADFNFWKVLEKMGADILQSPEKVLVKRKELNGINLNLKEMPDQVPTLAILALFAKGKTTITGIHHLRFKESDRISALISELSKLGAEINYQDSKLTINPLTKKIPKNLMLKTYSDHRLVMAFSILTMIFPYIKLDSVASVTKSFPEFFSYWLPLGENLDIKNSLKDITKYE